MFADEEGYGYDVSFTSQVQEYLKCVVCHLVLRNPVQIMKCGHHFCHPCFERMKTYSLHLNIELCCPIDRDVVNLNEVFTDAAMGRIVGSLEVKCGNNEVGCTWSDDLRYLQKHEEQCKHKVTKNLEDLSLQKQKEGDTAVLLKELCRRLDTCENAMLGKEKEVAHLKYNLHELRTTFNEKAEEINLLKKKVGENEEEIKQMKNLNEGMKVQFERTFQTLMNKNELMEGKISGLEKQLLVGGKTLEDKKDEKSLNNVMEELKNKLNEEMNVLSKEIKDVTCQCAKQQSSINEELLKIQEQINKHLDKDNNDNEDDNSCNDNDYDDNDYDDNDNDYDNDYDNDDYNRSDDDNGQGEDWNDYWNDDDNYDDDYNNDYE